MGTGIWFGLTHIDLFTLQKVSVIGNEAIPDTLIYKITQPYIGMNLLAIPAEDIKNKVMNLSRVKDVKLHKRLPSTIKLEINERKAAIY